MQFEIAPFALPAGYGDAIVAVPELRAHCQLLETDQDDLVEVYRDAAVDMVERYCELRLAPLTGLMWRGESLSAAIRLGTGPVTAITAITWLDDQGNTVTGNPADWRIVRRDEIALKPGRTLPSGVAGGVEITFDAGFAAGTCPNALVQAVRMFAAHLFLHRETVQTGTIAGEIPLGFKQLCGMYRVPVI